jgi:Icc-related predicted phosphoesterase
LAIKLIADPHGSYEGLAERVSGDDTLIVLGDIIDLVDWADLSGILPDLVGREVFIAKLFNALAEGDGAARRLRDELISPHGGFFDELCSRVSEQYASFSETLQEIGCRAYVIYGNGDIPELLRPALNGEKRASLAEGKVTLEGSVFGFVSGAIYSPFEMPAEMGEEEFGERLRELGKVDVLCTHIPPQVEEATMDVVAGRPVTGSSELLEYIHLHRPAFLYHGHVHQPVQRELMIGDTRVINVGYYKRERYVHTHETGRP